MNDGQNERSRAPSHVYSTQHVGPERWRDAACGMFPGLSIDWCRDHLRSAWLGVTPFADAQMIEIASSSPTRVLCARSPAGHSDRYSLALLLAGNSRTEHAGHDVIWETGDLVLFDSDRSFDAVHPGDYHLLMWSLPREALEPMLAAPGRSIGVRIAGSAGLGAVLSAYARALVTEAGRCDPATQRGLLTHLCGLVGLTLGASPAARESRPDTHRAVRRQQILSYIETHLRDPLLCAERAARDLRMSRRWLYALLEDGGISFAGWVARRRLETCRLLLDDPAHDHLSITDIAFRSGFDNLSTFNRRFRARYGMTPREARSRREGSG